MAKKSSRATRLKPADTCEQVTSLVLDYLRGTLDSGTALALDRHFRICPDCVSFVETYRKTIQATESLAYEAIPSEMVERVKRFLRARVRTRGDGR